MLRILASALALISSIALASSQEGGVATFLADLENCHLPAAPPKAAITDLLTGRGIDVFSLDEAKDQTPPCPGALPPGQNIPNIPAAWITPQLVKIKSDMGQCSGSLLSAYPQFGANAVITAAHCIYDSGRYAKNVKVMPGYQNGPNKAFGELTGLKVLTFTRYTADRRWPHDIAVIKLEGGVSDPSFSAYGLVPFRSNCATVNREYFRPNYSPQISSLEAQAYAGGAIGSCYRGMIISAVPTGGGSSGSPVVDPVSRAIFAVHSLENGQRSFEAPLTSAKVCAIFNFLRDIRGAQCQLD